MVHDRGTPRRALSLFLALAVPALALVPVAASGQSKPLPARTDKYDPENVTGISQYMEKIAKGTERYAAKDVTGAIDTYKQAVQLAPRNPLAHYLLAEAYLASGNMGEAEAAIQQAYEADAKQAIVRAHVLFLRAEIAERQKKWDQAKSAWQTYTEHVAKLGDAGVYPQTAAERLKAIQKVIELEKAYAAVRERIAADKADAGKSAPTKK